MGVENLDTENAGLLSDTVGLGANCSGNVSAVAVAIAVLTITSKVLQELGAALEFLSYISNYYSVLNHGK